MGVLYDYFAAASDEAAAGVIGQPGGPGDVFDAVPAKGVDPVVLLGRLEGLLTGRDSESVAASDPGSPPLAMTDDGEQVVLALGRDLQAALATATDDQVDAAAVDWARAEEFSGTADPGDLAALARDLTALARRAQGHGMRLYCWICV